MQSIDKEGLRALSSNNSSTGNLDSGPLEYNCAAGQQGNPNHYNKFDRPHRGRVGVANNHMMISKYNNLKEIAPVFKPNKTSQAHTRTITAKNPEMLNIFRSEERSWSRDPFAAEDEIYQMRMKSQTCPGPTENERET